MGDGTDDIRAIFGRPEEIQPADGWETAKPVTASVIPMRGDVNRLKPKARALLGHAKLAGEIQVDLDRKYLVKGWFDKGALIAIFAPPNTGKSFLMLNVAHHVAKGLEWGGRRVRRGRVLYLAAEGGASFGNRVAALVEPEFWVLTHGLTLTGPRADSAPLIEMIDHLSAVGGGFDLIVIDTLSRVLGEAEEDQKGFNDLVKNLDMITKQTGAAIVLIHHSGKDKLQGMRGSSVLKGAIDTEVQLSRDEGGVITAEVTKQRDGPSGYKFAYTLRQVQLGLDQDGDPVTTCVVEPAPPTQAGRAGLWESSICAMRILDKLLASCGEVIRKPNLPGSPSVPLADWLDGCIADDGVSASDGRENRRRQFNKCRDQLVDAQQVLVRDDRVWRVQG